VKFFQWLIAAALATTLVGCLGSSSKPPSYYLLTARATPIADKINTSIKTVGVGPVRVAPFLMRQQIVTHAGSGDLIVADSQRWSEPLEQGIQRVLLQNLATLTHADTRNFPWTQSTIPNYAIRIDVVDLDRTADGNAVLEVNWILEDLAQSKLLISRHETFTAAVTAGADNYAALSRAYSELFLQLAQKLSQGVSEQAAK
jgi:uncharacterized lipoprotein YmbA